jgi:hypothetical protein
VQQHYKVGRAEEKANFWCREQRNAIISCDPDNQWLLNCSMLSHILTIGRLRHE